MEKFSQILEVWYKYNARHLPWRETKDPYKIWISEIILQQTRVSQGYDYYCRFINHFPDVYVLANADEDEVMSYWQGLGYYSRARNLHYAAKTIAESGCFPSTYSDIRALKGVGDYTAAAIASFAFDLPFAVVDGNVYRVLSRWFGIEEPIDSTAGKKVFAELAQELLDKSSPALYNQAIMDFGALQCTPNGVDCNACPLADSCVANQRGIVDVLPIKQHKTKVQERYFIYMYVRAGDYTYVRKRNKNDIWQNLYEIPLIECAKSMDEGELLQSDEFLTLFKGCNIDFLRLSCKRTKHVLSHQVIWTDFYEINLIDETSVLDGYQRVRVDELHKFPVSRLISRFFSLILKPK